MTRKTVIGAVLVLISVPLVLVLAEAVTYHVAHRSDGTMVFAGQKREYLLHVPPSYHRGAPTPLVAPVEAQVEGRPTAPDGT